MDTCLKVQIKSSEWKTES